MKDEFVMLPSDLAESAVDAFASVGMHDELDQLNEILSKPAEQHQGEPVAWMYTRPEVEWPAFYDKRKDAAGWEETPLYTHADPGEPVIHPINMKTLMQAYEQVDHRALLHGTSNWCAAMATALRGVLCSGPSAPVERHEREEFEAAWSARIERLRIRERGNEFYRVQPNDLYRWSNVQDAWELWQARAALERKS